MFLLVAILAQRRPFTGQFCEQGACIAVAADLERFLRGCEWTRVLLRNRAVAGTIDLRDDDYTGDEHEQRRVSPAAGGLRGGRPDERALYLFLGLARPEAPATLPGARPRADRGHPRVTGWVRGLGGLSVADEPVNCEDDENFITDLSEEPDEEVDEQALLARARELRWGPQKIKFKDQACWGENYGCDQVPQSIGLCTRHLQLWTRIGTTFPKQKQQSWTPIIKRAAEIVDGYTIPVTLRQLFYRLVSEELILNNPSAYNHLSSLTARLRREDGFPALLEHGRQVKELACSSCEQSALDGLARGLQLDRAANQDYTIVLGVEKNALVDLLWSWFGDLGVPVNALGGYGSETLERRVRDYVRRYDREAIFIYAGDFDASGMNIGEKFIEHTEDCWDAVTRIGLGEAQIDELRLPILKGKPLDPRTPKFVKAYPAIHRRAGFGSVGGKPVPVQVELDAVEPITLHNWFQEEIDTWWDQDAYDETTGREKAGRGKIQHFADLMRREVADQRHHPRRARKRTYLGHSERTS